MEKITVKVIDPVGLHARPASIAVKTASQFKSNINVEYNGKVVIDDTLKAAIDAYYEQYGAK